LKNADVLTHTALDVLKFAKASGAGEAEVYVEQGESCSVRVGRQRVESVARTASLGAGVRVLMGAKLGFAYTTSLSRDALRSTVNKAMEGAAMTADDPSWVFARPAQSYAKMRLYDPRYEKVSMKQRMDLPVEIDRAARKFDKRIVATKYLSFSDGRHTSVIANSHGLLAAASTTGANFFGQLVAEEKGARQGAFGMEMGRSSFDLDPRAFAENTVRRCILCLGGKPMQTGKYPIVFDNRAGMMVLSAVADALNGHEVHLKRSFLAGKLGRKVASKLVDLVDDPLDESLSGAAAFDGEGTPCSTKLLISKGKLKGFIYDLRTARKAGVNECGNALRGSYAAMPSPGFHSLFIKPGKASVEDIIGGVKDGLYVVDTLGNASNAVTGDFSIGATGARIRNGELCEPVAGVTIGANLLHILADIDAVGNDLVMSGGNIGTPTFRVAEMTVAGK
jgi:PmbA protein